MLLASLHFTLLIALVVEVRAQNGGTLPNGDYFVCVPAGFCNNNPTVPPTPPPAPGIDPRIVTPVVSAAVCPAGQVACITQGPGSQCGVRFTAVSSDDGFTTAQANPWQAFIRNSTNPNYAGSGVLIDNYHVLTAAHKVAGDVNNPGAVTVSMGLTTSSNLAGVQTIPAARIILHPAYSGFPLLNNDLAIIRMSAPFSLSSNNVNTACLPAANTVNTYVGQTCMVAGWGETAFRINDQPTNPVKQVKVNVVDYNTCRTAYLPVLPNVDTYLDSNGSEICAGGQVNRDACTFDGGAPLTCPATGARATVAGLVIWGKGCGQPNVYGTYAYVPFHRAWIDSTLTQLNAG